MLADLSTEGWSLCCERTSVWESSRNYGTFQVSSEICLWLIQILFIWTPTRCLSQAICFPPFFSGTVAHVSDLCPVLSAPGAVPPFQPGIFCLWKGVVFPAAESTGSAWMGAEGTTAHFGLLLDLLLDGKLHSLHFLSSASHCAWSWPRIEGLKWPFLLPPAIRKLRLSCPMHKVEQPLGCAHLCGPVMVPREGQGLRNSLLREGPAHTSAW